MRQFVVITIVLFCCAVLSEGGRQKKAGRRWPYVQYRYYPNTGPKINDMILRCDRITDSDCRRWVRCRWGQIGTKCMSASGECYCDCQSVLNPEPEPETTPTAVPPTTTTVPPTTTTVPPTTTTGPGSTYIIIVD